MKLRQPNTFLLSSVAWDWFFTLTFRREVSLERGIADGLLWLERVRRRFRIAPGRWCWVLRAERGERFGRAHLHVLMRVPCRFEGFCCAGPGRVSWCHRAWGRGMTSVRRVVASDDPCVTYVTKEIPGSDTYETRKTAASINLVWSPALSCRTEGRCLRSHARNGQADRPDERLPVTGLA